MFILFQPFSNEFNFIFLLCFANSWGQYRKLKTYSDVLIPCSLKGHLFSVCHYKLMKRESGGHSHFKTVHAYFTENENPQSFL